jgi:hypothetical protein
MKYSFDELCDYLATTGGGYTLWAGAGAAIAATRGACPTWNELVAGIEASTAHATALISDSSDFPTRLEGLSETVGHARFRKELRTRLIDVITPSKIDVGNALDQAVIAARAGALVSFNIDLVSGYLLSVLSGGSKFLPRTLREKSTYGIEFTSNHEPGTVGKPVYLPHGTLFEGNVVITKSEYDRHVGSLAMATAVHLCIGTDLVILGMSLDDAYLREAILQNRRWIHNVFWVNNRFSHEEWSRVARVTCVRADYGLLWAQLARAIILADKGGRLAENIKMASEQLGDLLERLCNLVSTFGDRIAQLGEQIASQSLYTTEHFADFVQFCEDAGFDIPAVVAHDPRCPI